MKRLVSFLLLGLVGLAFVIPITSSLSAGTLKVTTPNAGQTWTVGKKYVIKWDKGNAGALVKIQLLKSNKHYKWITKKTKNDGKHPWKVHASIATGSAYKIKITSIKNKKVFDKSNRNFSIKRSAQKTVQKNTSAVQNLAVGKPTVTLSCNPSISTSENGGKFTCILRLSKISSRDVTVKVAYSGTASAGIDYAACCPGSNLYTHTIKAGATSAGFVLRGTRDKLNEGNETIIINVTSVTNAIENGIQRVKLTLIDQVWKSLTVAYPDGGEKLSTAPPITIRWYTVDGKGSVKIEVLGGPNIVSSTPNDGSHQWFIPVSLAGKHIKIKISSITNANVSDTSDKSFTVLTGPNLKLISPNGGEIFRKGQENDIRWNKSNNAGRTVELTLGFTGIKTVPNTGLYKWNPSSASHPPGKHKIRIRSVERYRLRHVPWEDWSDGYFEIVRAVLPIKLTSPNGGESLTTGKVVAIKWNKGDGKVKIELLKDGKSAVTIAASTNNDGSHNWLIPYTVTTGSNYKIKITSTTTNSVKDTSDGKFTITRVAEVTDHVNVSSPNGGESLTTGQTVPIAWKKNNGKGKVKIELLKGGKSSLTIVASTLNDGKHVWKIPSTVATGSNYQIQIVGTVPHSYYGLARDTSNGYFTITKAVLPIKLTSLNGGESLTTGKAVAIKWNKGDGGTHVKIELLKGGKSSLTIVASTLNDGKHVWKIPSTVATGSTYKLRITSTTKASVKDISDKNFTITKAVLPIKLTSPNGSESWVTGNKYVIKWNKGDGGTRVKIQLFKSGKHYKWVSKKTKNDGKYVWKIPSTVATGSTYKLRITSTTNASVNDISDKDFTISEADEETTSFKVTTPNGAEIWEAEMKYVIKWDKGDAGARINIQLLKSDKHNEWIAKNTKNDGRYLWQIPSTAFTKVTSTDYKIKIISSKNKKISDSSDKSFTITKAGGDDAEDSSDNSSDDNSDDSSDGSDNSTIEDEQDSEKLCPSELTECNRSGDDIIWSWRIGSEFTVWADDNCNRDCSQPGSCDWCRAEGCFIQCETNISWRCSFAGCSANIDLYKGGSFHSTITSGNATFYELDPDAPDVPYLGLYDWPVPTNLAGTGSDYQIKVSISGDSGTNSYSNLFPIVSNPN